MPSSRVLQGILAMLAAVVAFAVMDATLKQLSQAYPPMQVSALRGLTAIPFFLVGFALLREHPGRVPVQWGGHLIRGALAIAMLWTFVYAVSRMPLGTAYGIFLCAPLLVTALSAVVWREHVGLHRWCAVVFGLVGVVVILNPQSRDAMTLAGLAALCAAVCYALGILMIRGLARTESTLMIGFSFVLIVGVGCGIAAYPNWVPLSRAHWPWIAVLGFSGTVGQYLIIYAFRSAPASVVAPFEYTALLWGIALDWVLWSTVPNARMLCGAGMVIASGLYVIYREHWADRR